MRKLAKYAENELKMAGLFDEDGDYGGMIGKAVMRLIRALPPGASGMSREMTVEVFSKVARFEPLTPLTGGDEEWLEPVPGTLQNCRCSRVLKENGQAYDVCGRLFREPAGACYFSGGSRVPVTFPYMPKTEYVDVPA